MSAQVPVKAEIRDLKDGYRFDIQVRKHLLRADEPSELGGSDSGPTPMELCLSALGACTAMTIRMYADRKAWKLESVDVVLEMIDAINAHKAGKVESPMPYVLRKIRLIGDLDEEQRVRLQEIADRCPVHRFITGEKRVETLIS
jgi:putative redox protein